MRARPKTTDRRPEPTPAELFRRMQRRAGSQSADLVTLDCLFQQLEERVASLEAEVARLTKGRQSSKNVA